MSTATLTRTRRTINLPVQMDQLADLTAQQIAEELGDARRARRWLTSVTSQAPAALVPHIDLSQMVVLLEQALPGSAIPGVMDVESAIARGDWQSAYDISMGHNEASTRALAGLMLVVDALHTAGQNEAVLNLLGRALDLYEGTPAVYWALIQVLTEQGRSDDGQAALELLQAAVKN